jgi:hypothetical protein
VLKNKINDHSCLIPDAFWINALFFQSIMTIFKKGAIWQNGMNWLRQLFQIPYIFAFGAMKKQKTGQLDKKRTPATTLKTPAT